MTATKAYAAMRVKAPLAPYSIERRTPRDHDVSIDIKFCGICHSDIHQVHDEWGGSIFPMVPGHEISGIVSAVGAKVTKFRIGDPVGVGVFVDSCRKCPQCRNSLEQYCDAGMVLTYNGHDCSGAPTLGGYSQQIVVHENYVLGMPANLPLDTAAPLLCAGITLYSPLKHWRAGPGKKVAIVGLGGLGHMGVKLAHLLGAEVTVLSRTCKKRADAIRFGAHDFFDTSDPQSFLKLQKHFDLMVSTVSSEMDLNQYLNLLKIDGAMVLVGLPEKPATLAAASLIDGRRSLAGSSIGGIDETQQMLDFCGQHKVACDIERIPIQKVNDAYERVLRGDVRYRFVIDIASLA